MSPISVPLHSTVRPNGSEEATVLPPILYMTENTIIITEIANGKTEK